MRIFVSNLALRFYKEDGWTEEKVRDYLIDKTMEISERNALGDDRNYYACYEKSGYKIFSKRLWENKFHNPLFNDITWYIGDCR